ncbi:sirohydrochlorin chelatase [Streptomyces indicus]|uniref:Sirohydrochlorin ferrochelatase n=1 Tax=Streptomyces indicus TaxID=417292 RepID=A0A1G9H0K0_9ACTN|nr:CbiX/SirB N-terminal domain-containing protein [Streptomyces indicus]SDL06399.1 Sirohydrochlorin ferrochelatase [Streptomyces indicus]
MTAAPALRDVSRATAGTNHQAVTRFAGPHRDVPTGSHSAGGNPAGGNPAGGNPAGGDPAPGDQTPALVLAVHGSAVAEAGETVRRLCDAVEAHGGIRPLVGHMDHQAPSLTEVLDELDAAGRKRAVVVPLLLGDGFHRTVDIPQILAAPRTLDTALTEGLSGESDVALALYGRLREAECRAGERADAVVVAAAGSSRAGGNDGARTAVGQLSVLLDAERGPVPVLPAYCSSSEPTVPEAVALLRAAGYRRIAVATHLLAPGRFTHALAEAGAWTVAEPLADHPRIARLVLRRYAAALRPARRVRAAA